MTPPTARSAAPAFDGFAEGIIEFYEGLAADNSKAFWADHKPFYEAGVLGPMRALAAALEPEFGAAKIFRPNRDVRFSADKSPYKVNVSMVAGSMSAGALYLEVSARGLFIGGGLYEPARDQLERFRRLQDEPVVAADLDRALHVQARAGFALGHTDSLKSAPRGWSADHPRIELLRRKRLAVSRLYPPADPLFTGECFDVVVEGWRAVQLWNRWLVRHVGPPEAPAAAGVPSA